MPLYSSNFFMSPTCGTSVDVHMCARQCTEAVRHASVSRSYCSHAVSFIEATQFRCPTQAGEEPEGSRWWPDWDYANLVHSTIQTANVGKHFVDFGFILLVPDSIVKHRPEGLAQFLHRTRTLSCCNCRSCTALMIHLVFGALFSPHIDSLCAKPFDLLEVKVQRELFKGVHAYSFFSPGRA